MKLEVSISRQALKDKDYKSRVEIKTGSTPKKRSADALSELLQILKRKI